MNLKKQTTTITHPFYCMFRRDLRNAEMERWKQRYRQPTSEKTGEDPIIGEQLEYKLHGFQYSFSDLGRDERKRWVTEN